MKTITIEDLPGGPKLYQDVRAIMDQVREIVPSFQFDALSLNIDLCNAERLFPGVVEEMAVHADGQTLIHDVAGIMRHTNRETFEIENCFVPRCADAAAARAAKAGAGS